jgi:hypothetical protein
VPLVDRVVSAANRVGRAVGALLWGELGEVFEAHWSKRPGAASQHAPDNEAKW